MLFSYSPYKKTLSLSSSFLLVFLLGFALYTLLGTAATAAPNAGVIYVDVDVAGGAENGTNWSNAYSSLQDALADPMVVGSEIWVAQGVYTPGNTVDASFVLTDDVAIYGGFDGTETMLADRDFDNNLTVLSGDIDGDDDTNVMTNTTPVGDNNYHVVTANGVTTTAVLDGFTITAGGANGNFPNNSGGGMANFSNSSPTLSNVSFSGNSANGNGGGIANFSNSSPMMSNVSFSDNFANDNGGGMYNENSSPTMSNVSFWGNSADRGGGIANFSNSSPTMSNVFFTYNIAYIDGGGMYNDSSSPTLSKVSFPGNAANISGGGMYNENSSPTISNVSFSGNLAIGGGGMYNENSSPTMSNVSFSGNFANNGGGMANSNSSPTIMNSIFWDNLAGGDIASAGASVSNSSSTPTFSHSLVANSGGSSSWNTALGTDGGNNIDEDPVFVTAVNPAYAPTMAGDLRLHSGSTAIDAGNTISYTNISTETTDLAGNPRIFNTVIDMGAYENQTGCPVAGSTIYVNHAATGGNDGTSWADAYADLQDGLFLATACGISAEIWVAQGGYTPGDTVDASFVLTDDVAIYGGFDGTETMRTDRDFDNNLTVLSGDIYGDDTDLDSDGVILDRADIAGSNSYHVVTAGGVTTTAVLDGFTITAGQANGSFPNNSGGGMYNSDSSPTLSNVSFSGNSAASRGGGMANFSNSSPTLSNVSFSSNFASLGGGMYNSNSSPTLSNVSFSGNSASNGGGMANFSNNSSLTLSNVSFSGNSATSNGGGMYNLYSSPTLSNVSFSGGSATFGGGMANRESSPTLSNVSFSGNSANTGGGMYNNNTSNPTIVNSIFWDNQAGGDTTLASASVFAGIRSAPMFSHSLVANSGGSSSWNTDIGTDGGNNIDEDPLFVMAVDPTTAPTTAGDLSLLLGSPAIDAGNTISYTNISTGTTDLAGNPRIFDTVIDMGAYEFYVTHTLTVTSTGTGSGNVTGMSAGISCGDTCTATFIQGEIVTLAATADAGSTFTGWSGAVSSTNAMITVTMDMSQAVTATFDLNAYVLAVTSAGTGAGDVASTPTGINCGVTCTTTLDYGTIVTLTATADAGSTFTGWSGAVSSTNATITVTMDMSQVVTATFTADEPTSYSIFVPLITKAD